MNEERQRAYLKKYITRRHIPHTYRPVRNNAAAFLNANDGGLDVLRPVAPERMLQAMLKSCNHDQERRANLAVARGLLDLVQKEAICGRIEHLPSISLRIGQSAHLWLNIVANIRGMATFVSLDVRANPLTKTQRQFLFSLMHHGLREAHPDYQEAAIAIISFAKENEGVRPAILHMESEKAPYSAEKLEMMIHQVFVVYHQVFSELQESAAQTGNRAIGGLL